jgi:hypothetical protein
VFCLSIPDLKAQQVKAVQRHLAKFLARAATALLAAAGAIEVYILLFPAVTQPYGIGAGVFAVGVAGWLIWLATRTAAYLLSGEEGA